MVCVVFRCHGLRSRWAARKHEEERVEAPYVVAGVVDAQVLVEFFPPDSLKAADIVVRDFHAKDDSSGSRGGEGARHRRRGSEDFDWVSDSTFAMDDTRLSASRQNVARRIIASLGKAVGAAVLVSPLEPLS